MVGAREPPDVWPDELCVCGKELAVMLVDNVPLCSDCVEDFYLTGKTKNIVHNDNQRGGKRYRLSVEQW